MFLTFINNSATKASSGNEHYEMDIYPAANPLSWFLPDITSFQLQFGDNVIPSKVPLMWVDGSQLYEFYESYLGHTPRMSLRWFCSSNFQLPLIFDNYGTSPALSSTTIEGLRTQTQGAYANVHLEFKEL